MQELNGVHPDHSVPLKYTIESRRSLRSGIFSADSAAFTPAPCESEPRFARLSPQRLFAAPRPLRSPPTQNLSNSQTRATAALSDPIPTAYKVVLSGTRGSGKTALIRRLLGRPISSPIAPTTDPTLYVYPTVISGQSAILELWDSAGADRSLFRNAAGLRSHGSPFLRDFEALAPVLLVDSKRDLALGLPIDGRQTSRPIAAEEARIRSKTQRKSVCGTADIRDRERRTGIRKARKRDRAKIEGTSAAEARNTSSGLDYGGLLPTGNDQGFGEAFRSGR